MSLCVSVCLCVALHETEHCKATTWRKPIRRRSDSVATAKHNVCHKRASMQQTLRVIVHTATHIFCGCKTNCSAANAVLHRIARALRALIDLVGMLRLWLPSQTHPVGSLQHTAAGKLRQPKQIPHRFNVEQHSPRVLGTISGVRKRPQNTTNITGTNSKNKLKYS